MLSVVGWGEGSFCDTVLVAQVKGDALRAPRKVTVVAVDLEGLQASFSSVPLMW